MQKHLRKFINNKRGLTLIEILAALTIGTIVIGLAFSVLLNSMNAYKRTENKQLLQQEANIILTQLRTIHRSESTYVIGYSELENQYKITLANGKTENLGNSNYKIELAIDNIVISETNAQSIDSTRNDYQLSLKMNDPTTNNEFSIVTGLTRL